MRCCCHRFCSAHGSGYSIDGGMGQDFAENPIVPAAGTSVANDYRPTGSGERPSFF